jgi:hypothetical protein
MAGNTPTQLWTVGFGHELHGGFRAAEDQVKIAHGIWFSYRQQTEKQMEAKAS